MNDAMLSSLRSYWDRLRAGRAAPYRAEIDPREFESALENMFILERLSSENMRVRLAGMKLCEMMDMEVRGMEAGFLLGEADRPRFERLLNVAMSEPAVVEIRLEAAMRSGSYRAAMLLMPLRSDLGEMNRVLGCLSGEGDYYTPPLSFSIRDVSVTPIESETRADMRTRALLPGFAEDQPAFIGRGPKLRAIEGNPGAAGRVERTRPYLRVIESE